MHVRIAGLPLSIACDAVCHELAVHAFGHLRGPAVPGATPAEMVVGEVPPARTGSAGLGVYRLAGGGVCVHEPGRLVETYRPATGIRLVVDAGAASDPELVSHPIAAAVAAWALDAGVLAFHAGAVEADGRAVLLVGANGAGKSTAALAAAVTGFGYLGDDLCLVDPAAAEVHSWYATAKLLPDSVAAIGTDRWPRLAVNRLGKAVVCLQHVPTVRLVAGAPIAAIAVLDRRSTAPPGRLRPAEAVPALRSTAVPGPGGMGPWLHAVVALSRRVPVHRVPATWDLAALVDTLRGLASCEATA